MASAAAGSQGWLRGKVKAVPSGDCLVIMAITSNKQGLPAEKTITLSSTIAPRLARRDGVDEPFAWDSREFLRKLCIGKEVVFRVEYQVPSIGREFGSVFLGDKNVAELVVSQGWAKVREQGQQKGEPSDYVAVLKNLEDLARSQGLGRWTTDPGAVETSIRNLPPSAIGSSSGFDSAAFLAANKGRPLQGIVEQVRDGSTIRVYLLPEFQFVQVFVAGIQAPHMGRRPVVVDSSAETNATNAETNGEASSETRSSAQRVAAGVATTASIETPPEDFGPEAKHFTEIRMLNRDVRIILEAADKFGNLVGSVYYPDGETAKDLAMELVENGLAKYVDWSASFLKDDSRRQRLKAAELQSKRDKVKMWEMFKIPETNSKPILNLEFTGKVVEVASGDCIVVADDSVPFGSTSAERRVNLSSIRYPRAPAPRSGETIKPEDIARYSHYAREAKEFLRKRIIGKQVSVKMEYSRMVEGNAAGNGPTDARKMEFGSVFLVSPAKGDTITTSAASPAKENQQPGVNLAELLVQYGLATVVNHRDFEDRSKYYDALLSAEINARTGRKGIYSSKQPSGMHIADLTTSSAKKARDFLPSLQRLRRIPAVVEYVLSGHRFKIFIPKETCTIAFSFSGVRCPGRGEPYSDEAIAFMRRKIMQRDVEIEVETLDRTGTFLGSLWESRTNMAVPLLEAGLAKLQTSFGTDRITDANLLQQAEKSARTQKLKIWEKYVEGEEVPNGVAVDGKEKEVLKVLVTEVLDGGKFYVQTVGDQRVASIQQQLASLSIREAPVVGAFNPKKGDIVLAQFSVDNSWNRAMIVNAPRAVGSVNDKFEVFYIDYGNQEEVPYGHLRPLDSSLATAPPLAQLCSLAYIKVPSLEDEYGPDAAQFFSEQTLGSSKEFRAKIEERDSTGGKTKGQGTGSILLVTLVAVDAEVSVNAAMLQEGLARMEKRKKWDSSDRQLALDNLEKFQNEAKTDRRGMWQYGDVESDDEDPLPGAAAKKTGGRR